MDILRKTLTKDEKIMIQSLAMNLRGCTIITSSKKGGGGCPQNDNRFHAMQDIGDKA
jgi:hypothetical protein